MSYVDKNTPSSPDPGTINVTLFIHCLMYEKTHNIGCSFYINDLRILSIFNFLGSVVVRGRYYKYKSYFQHVRTMYNKQHLANSIEVELCFFIIIYKQVYCYGDDMSSTLERIQSV